MIHAKNGRSAARLNEPAAPAPAKKLVEAAELNKKVETWVRNNPVLGIGLALGMGVAIGWLIKRKLL